jgi:hypothetical protein
MNKKNKEEVTWNNKEYQRQTLDEDQISKYKKMITEGWNKTRDAIINVGKSLLEAKKANQKKTFNTRSFKKLVESELPFSRVTAHRLIGIAECEWIVSGEYNDSLPVSWGSLYQISTLLKEQFMEGIKTGAITANTPRVKIEEFKDSFKDPKPKKQDTPNSSSEDSATETNEVKKGKNDFALGSIIINKNKVMKDKALNVEMLRKLTTEIVEAVTKVSKDIKVDFSSINKEIDKIENKEWNETYQLGYDKLKVAVKQEVSKDEYANEYDIDTPEGNIKIHNDFFKVPDLQFIATKVVERFGVDCLDNALKDVSFPEDYYEDLRKTAELKTEIAA